MGPVLRPSAVCQNDSVHFRLKNIGTSIFPTETYYVFEDHVIMNIGATGTIPPGATTVISVAADTGHTYRIQVPQVAGYPKLLGIV